MGSKGVDVIIEDLNNHPHCPHGPTILFSRVVKGEKKRFFACAACREHSKKHVWQQEIRKYLKGINHQKKFFILQKALTLLLDRRVYCNTCSQLVVDKENEHVGHNLLKGISDYQFNHPTEFLPPLDDSRKEAQYLFSRSSVKALINIFRDLKYMNIICIGTPRIHEYIKTHCKDMNSILLDIDSRFHNFFGPLEFCWYNLFNHHFFFNEARIVFQDFLQCDKGKGMVVVTDPPFGGRTEPIAFTLKKITEEYKGVNNIKSDLPVFWIFPYFMEPQILNDLENFRMLDYKVDYDNHSLFQEGPKGRKFGSPVRIFTNVEPGLITLPEDGYHYCKPCDRWVAKENVHCNLCNICPSKDGRTYVHCPICKKCVKPSWKHCITCGRCTLPDHNCSTVIFSKECFHCKEFGHKKSECPQLNQSLYKKRKLSRHKKSKKHTIN